VKLPNELEKGDFLDSVIGWSKLSTIENNYNDVFLGIVDLIGFTSLLSDKGDGAPNFLVGIIAGLMSFADSSYRTIHVQLLSDTIIVYSEDAFNVSFYNVYNVLDQIRYGLLKHGILCRGAIVRGKSFIANGVIVSPAFITAYKIEQEECIYPRIIWEKSTFDPIRRETQYSKDGIPGFLHKGVFRMIDTQIAEIDFDGQVIGAMTFSDSSVLTLLLNHYPGEGRAIEPENIETIQKSALIALNVFKTGILLAKERTRTEKERMKVNYVINVFNRRVRQIVNFSESERLELEIAHA